MSKNKNVIFFLLTYKEQYVKLFEILLKSISKYSNKQPNFDIVIITHDRLIKPIKKIKYLGNYTYDFMTFPEPKDLYEALKVKANFFDYPKIDQYKKALFFDVDIIVQNDLNKLFDEFNPKDGILYALHEQNGSHYHKFWSLLKYTPAELKTFYEKKIITFNVGTMMFAITPKMRKHFENLKHLVNTEKSPFYEQSFFNHYFNKAQAIDTDFFQNKVVIFPIGDAYYAHPTFIHFAGIGQYEIKTEQMGKYLQILSKNKHAKLIN